MRSRQKDIISILVVVALVIGAIYWMWAAWPPRLGLDLRGGMNVVLTAKETKQAKVTEDAIGQAKFIIEQRVNALGVTEPIIERQIGTPNIIVQLPGVKDAKKALDIIGRTAILQFREVLSVEPAKLTPGKKRPALKTGEFLDKEGKLIYKLGPPVMTGRALRSASAGFGDLGEPKVDMSFTSEGSAEFENITGRLVGKQLAIVLDDRVMSAPTVQNKISGGRAEITGKFTLDQVKELVIVLNTGALPVDLKVTEQQTIGPTLGQDSLKEGLRAGIAGLIIVAVFLVVSYRGLGLISLAALAVFTTLFGGALISIGATLTLPSIAGIILTIGFAADSGIVFFERFKEEVGKGKTSRAAASQGFAFAWRTIIDADAVSLIIAATLITLSYFYFGAGPVRGFAFTLSIGILTDIFTAFFFTRPALQLLSELTLFKNPVFIGTRRKAA